MTMHDVSPEPPVFPNHEPMPLGAGYVVLRWQRGVTRWSHGSWQMSEFLLSVPETVAFAPRAETGGVPVAVLRQDEAQREVVFGPLPLVLHPAEAEGIWLNVTAPQPRVFGLLRCDEGQTWPTPRYLTVSQHEAARWMDGGEWVEACPLPRPFWEALAAYGRAHYRPETKKRRRRNDPFGILKRSTDEADEPEGVT